MPLRSWRKIWINRYIQPYAADKRQVVCIGANFSSAARTVEGWEEIWRDSQS
ncbi:hypothetical protein [Bacteroides sp.]|uniref:hypothetical protein n=1 Tax=Bacteroides sp. TaxID=29523 RepID=UPI0023CBB0B5|nr:hypothetical protein [Bacteroides sp.]MDE6215595.1 hypothetical protein [Bacteroides sp.]